MGNAEVQDILIQPRTFLCGSRSFAAFIYFEQAKSELYRKHKAPKAKSSLKGAFNFTAISKKGKEYRIPDALSRAPVNEPTAEDICNM